MLGWNYLLKALVYLTLQTSAIKFTRKFQFETQNPYTVSIRSNIYTVSKNETHMKIVSSDKNYRPCTIDIDPKRDHIDDRIRAVALGTNKIIVYGVDHAHEEQTVKFVQHTVLLVDPFSCTSKHLVGAEEDRVPVYFPAMNARVLPFMASKFDVFFLGAQTCAPCRFNAEGTAIPLQHQVQSGFSPLSNFYVQYLRRSGGYAYAVVYANGLAALKVLDKDFEVINEKSLNISIFDLSAASATTTSYIGLTYNKPDDPYKFFYSLYDSTLRLLFERPLPSLGSDYLGLGAQLNIDSRGKSYISFQQMSSEEGSTKVSLIVYNVRGSKIGGSNDLAEISTGGYEIHTLLMEDREYCLVVHEFDEPYGVTKVNCMMPEICDSVDMKLLI